MLACIRLQRFSISFLCAYKLSLSICIHVNMYKKIDFLYMLRVMCIEILDFLYCFDRKMHHAFD